MGAAPTLRRMSSVRKAEHDLALAIEAASADESSPPVDSDDDASVAAAVDAILARVGGTEMDEAGADSGVLTPRPPARVVVRLDALEVTQEVQDLPHSVPLVAGKSTIVRAYLSRPGTAVTVRGELRVARSVRGPWRSVPSLGTAQLSPSRQGTAPEDLHSRRADLRYSLNFRLPADLVADPGTLWLRLGTLRRSRGVGAVPSVAHVRRHRRTLSAGVPLRLRLVLLPYTSGGTTHTPTATDVDHLRSYLRRAYPVSEVLMTTRTVPASSPAPFTAAQVNAQLAAIRAVDVATGTDARTHYYGMVSSGGFFMRGQASGIPGTPQPATVASGPTGSSGFAWDTDGSWGDWYGAHELGHTLGRLHAMFCGAGGGGPYPFANGQLSDADQAFVGIDDGETALGLPTRVWHPITSHDVMTYCDDQWLSSFTYEGIYDRLVAEDALASGAVPGAGAGADGGGWGMRLFASLNLDRAEGLIAAVLPTELVGEAPVDSAADARDARDDRADGAGHTATVISQVLDAEGTVLDERPVPFVLSSCEDPDEDVTATVDAVLPDREGAAVVRLLVNGTVVAEHQVGGRAVAPSLPDTPTDTGGDRPGGNGSDVLHLEWAAPGASGSQRYVVQVSSGPDGEVWETVAVDLAEPVLDLPGDQFETETVRVRVLATTGTGTVEVQDVQVQLR
ncbi:hypothetical protein SAMN05421879_11059 [Ornithinimicrobium cerasi]|uniref:Uncharacterized protein n=2 Tax=Ornithinimicrobium cerasi TaxID=2248773 RepID=A0A285VSJ6_9MICO|nr:hypothetical protein SAMN05421879_11059 [Ornithinimicrobium cerasi]